MQPFVVLATFAALSSSVFGAPASCPCIHSVPSSTALPNGPEPRGEQLLEQLYYLKTVVKFPNPLHRFATSKDNLYIMPFHTAAGIATGILDKNRALSYPGSLRNDTQFEFNIGSTARFLSMDYPTTSENWFPVRFSASGLRTPGFFLNMTDGLQWKSDRRGYADRPWGGWLACDWNLGETQLFWWSPKFGRQNEIPTSCDIVNLMMERA